MSASLQMTSLTGDSSLQMQRKEMLMLLLSADILCVAFKDVPVAQQFPMTSIHMQLISDSS